MNVFLQISFLIILMKQSKCERYWNSVSEQYLIEGSGKYQYRLYCASGWSNDGTYPDCPYAICDGKIRSAACKRFYPNDIIRTRTNHGGERYSGGSCISPNRCSQCNEGFYSDGPYCRICPYIDHCNHRQCTSIYDNHCEWCEGVIKEKASWRSYRSYDLKKSCKQTCSWRSDSTRCYPGVCDEELASKCTCMRGFGGVQCDKIMVDVEVVFAEAKLTDIRNISLQTPVDPNEVGAQPIRWTNNVAWRSAEIQFYSKFPDLGPPPSLDPHGENHFVTEFKYGIISATMALIHERGGNQSSQTLTVYCYSNENMPLSHKVCTRTKTSTGNREINVSSWQFRHADKLKFRWSVRNGGYIRYIDREANRNIRVPLNGRTSSTSYTFQWDLIQPYHICATANSTCYDPPLTTTDEVTEKETITLPTPGMYSITVSVFDKAGNYKSTRCLVFYDNQSNVEIKPSKMTMVKQSSKKTNYTWVSVNDKILLIDWKDRFVNLRHYMHSWLGAVASLSHVDDVYDDHEGNRTVMTIPNARGVVRFEIKYSVFAPNLTDQQAFIPTPTVFDESGTVNVTWDDGNRLDITIRAIDIFEKFAEETITVYKDSSPPQIENVWLTNGDHVNLSVHRSEDFTKMTIEWEAMDYDSGLNQVKWRLFDNYTGNYIYHGADNLHTQGSEKNITECEQKYQTQSRGPSCYCTLFQGCYNKHFYFTPGIAKDAGLEPGKEKGVHNSFYYIEVTVINNALLETTFIKKIKIDISPPHNGLVHDGIEGAPEVDYQQDLHLDGYWEGFFDGESAVEFYRYVYSNYCLSEEEFKQSTEKIKTYKTFSYYDAPDDGTYFLSVVAVNIAQQSSNVVCSDGVTITSTVPFIKDFILVGARNKSRLVQDENGNIWLFDNTLKFHLIENTKSCRASIAKNIEIFPESYLQSSNIDSSVCYGKGSLRVLAVTNDSAQLDMSWSVGINQTLIHDFEVGLSSTSSGACPDIIPFLSSKQQTYFTLDNHDNTTGKEFYVVVKSVSKSAVIGIQSFGPFIADTTDLQLTTGQKITRLQNGFLIGNLSSASFANTSGPYLVQFQYPLDTEDQCRASDGYVFFSSIPFCFKFHKETVGISQAVSFCVAESSTLVKVDRVEKRNAILHHLFDVYGFYGHAFIQGHRETAKSSNWTYDDGTEVTYLPWNSGQPSNTRNEVLMVMNSKAHGLFHDVSPAQNFSFICEKNLP